MGEKDRMFEGLVGLRNASIGGILVDKQSALWVISTEYERAIGKFPPIKSAHEGYAIIKEEVDELWSEIKHNPKDWDAIKTEAIQVAAMAMRFLIDVCPDKEE